ncbi:hypothetical protein [Streptomyces sp. NPDC001435]|uniref:hypothetical protein n=1 Tax=Streptomyces sp. NPDC001435 TaxID=3364576 RepID=UPI00369C38D2
MSQSAEQSRPPISDTILVGTTSRFVLFFGTLVISAVPYYQWFAEYVLSVMPTTRDCVTRSPVLPDPAAYTAVLGNCDKSVGRLAILWELAAVGLLILASLGLYLLHPVWLRIRRPVLPPSDVDHETIAAELPDLAQQMRVPVPELRIRAVNEQHAVARGRIGRYEIYLDAGLAWELPHRPQMVRAKIRHELAHLRSGDVDLTRVAISAWWVFLALVVAPLALHVAGKVSVGGAGSLWFGSKQLLFSGALLLVVHLALRAVIHAREHQADIASALHDREGLLEALRPVPSRGGPEPTVFQRCRARLRTAKDTHPSEAAREEIVRDPSLLSRYDKSDAFIAALAVGLAFAGLESTARRLTGNGFWSVALAAMVLGMLFGGVLASWAVRAAVQASRLGARMPWGTPLALAATAGLLAGQALAWDLPTLNVSWDDVLAVSPQHGLLLICVLTAGLVCLVRVTAATAMLWHISQPSAGRAGAVLLALVTAMMFAVLFTFWRGLHSSELSLPRTLRFSYNQMDLSTPGLVAVSVLLLAAFGLVSLLAPAAPGAADNMMVVRRLVLMAGAAAGVVALAQVSPFSVWWDFSVSVPGASGVRELDLQLVSIAVAVQAVVAVMASWSSGFRGATVACVVGVSAAGLAGAAMVTVVWVRYLAVAPFRDQPVDWSWFQDVAIRLLGQGLVAVVPFAVAGALTGRLIGLYAAWAARTTDTEGAGPPRVPTPCRGRRRTWVVAVLALSVAATGVVQLGGASPLPQMQQAGQSQDEKPPDVQRAAFYDPKFTFGIPTSLDAENMCAWLPHDYGAQLVLFPDDARWIGRVLARSTDRRVAKIGKAVVAGATDQDSTAMLDAFNALTTLCIVVDDPEARAPGAGMVAHDECLLGTWRLTAAAELADLTASGHGFVAFTNAGRYTTTYRRDGTATDATVGYSLRAVSDTATVTLSYGADRRYDWSAGNGLYLQHHVASDGKPSLTSGGTVLHQYGPGSEHAVLTSYTCDARHLRFHDDGYSETFERIS